MLSPVKLLTIGLFALALPAVLYGATALSGDCYSISEKETNQLKFFVLDSDYDDAPSEIGRASCRERV
jgi:hypothetical protein